MSGDTGNGSYLGHINNTGSQSEDNGLHIQIASSGSGSHGLKVQTGGSANAFIVSGDGKVGLGYSSGSMTEIFNVNGNAAIAGTLSAVTTTNSDVTVANFQSAIDANGEHSIIRVGHGSKAAYMGLLLNSADTAYFGIDDNPDDGNGIYVNESGSVGIGTDAPSFFFTAIGDATGDQATINQTHASYAGSALKIGAVRAANSAYNLLYCATGTSAAGTGGTAQFVVSGDGNATLAGNIYLSNDKAIWMRNNAGNADTSAIFTNTSD